MTERHAGPVGRSRPSGGAGDRRASEVLDRVSRIEARLDPVARRRGRIIADVVTVATLAPLSFALEWHATRPLLMLTLMAVGLLGNRLIPRATERSLRRQRDRLLELDGTPEDAGPR